MPPPFLLPLFALCAFLPWKYQGTVWNEKQEVLAFLPFLAVMGDARGRLRLANRKL
jgi:hypothetical protein